MDLTPYTKSLTDKIRLLAQTYLKQEETLSATERCCISFNGQTCSFIKISNGQGPDEIETMQTFEFDNFTSLALILRGAIEKNNLIETPLSWRLGCEDYQINLIESLPVPDHEIQTALSWRIRSLIDYPIDDAVMEYFQLPPKKSAQKTPFIGAVTAKKSLLQPVVSLLKNVGLKLVAIDIPELSLLRLAALYETDEKCTAFLYFYEKIVILNISSRKILYFTRQINVPFSENGDIDYEKISLEILRYFDFFRSQWRLPSPTRIFAAAENSGISGIANMLSERLLNKVLPYSLNMAMDADEKAEIESKYLLDYGCLLRKESANATPRN